MQETIYIPARYSKYPCLNELCENAATMAKAIRKQKSGHPTYVSIRYPTYIFFDIFEKYLSDSDDSKCMKNVCKNCQPAKIS